MITLAADGAWGLLFKGHAWWLVLPLTGALVWAIVRLYRHETEPYVPGGKLLRGLRGAGVALLVLLLSQPVIHRVFARYQPPLVLVLRDASPSMHVTDAHEPPEARVRAAVALGLIDAAKRDTRAEQAADGIARAQTDAEAAAVQVRQALPQLQSGVADTARDRLHDAARALGATSEKLTAALELWKPVPQADAGALNEAQATLQETAALKAELDGGDLESPEARQRLSERANRLTELAKRVSKLALAAKREQDRLDRALAEQGGDEIKQALEKLARLDRGALTAAILDQHVAPKTAGRIETVTYELNGELRQLHEPSDEKNSEAKPDAPHTQGETDLATPLLRLAERHAQDRIAAVVLCSDGRHTSGPVPEEAARALAARGIPLHTLGVGSQEPPPDLCVARLDGSGSVFLEETVRLVAHIKVAGFQNQKAKLVLRRGEETLATRELTFDRQGWRHETFEFPAKHAGPNVFHAELEALPGEALAANNAAEAVVDVANDRLKVLLADHLPRWESRYVAALLRRERKMTLDERWLLGGENLGSRPAALPEKETDLDAYDVVILGDVPPERLDEAAQKRLARYVSDRGGFLVLLAGPEAMPRSYLAGPLSELLPVSQQAPADAAAPVTSAAAPDKVRLKLDPAADRSEIVRILRDPTLNEQLWPALPELPWIARPAYAKPGATPLLYTDDARRDVVVALHHYGAGRVLYVGTDQTWRWREKVADRVHAVFWAQAIRWGTGNRLTGGPRLKAALSRRQVRPGEDVEVLARPLDAEGRAVENAVVLAEVETPEHRQRVQLKAIADGSGLYRGVLRNLPAGAHKISVKVDAPAFAGITHELNVLVREVTGQEGVELSRDTARLAAMAKTGGGRHLDILQAPELFEQLAGEGKDVTVESSYELWSSYPILILVTLLFSLEWIWRKRLGLP